MEHLETTKKRSGICTTWKSKTLFSALALIGAVALPQIFHLLGMVSELGSSLGEAFLPMHITVFLAGYFAGSLFGGAVGLLAPAVSFLLTSAMGQAMPALPMLPYMTIELAVYGLVTGLFSGRKVPVICSLLLAQAAGRGVRAVAILIGSLLGSPIAPAVIWSSVLTGLPGLVLQWVLVPLIVFYAEKRRD